MLEKIKALLAHPDVRDLGIDHPRTTQRRRGVIQSNRFLWRIYDEWYRLICARIPEGRGGVLEVGSGAGFLAEYLPGLMPEPSNGTANDRPRSPVVPGMSSLAEGGSLYNRRDAPCRSVGIGRRTGLKIRRTSLGVWVQVPPPAPTFPFKRPSQCLIVTV